jgi:hypothetical protein
MIMSEIKKNIETCRGEDVLAEVSALPQDPHFGSLVNEALDPLKQQALHQAGYDGYSEVIAQHKPYTFASAIIQMKSNLLLLLRALWQFPFGAGTLRSLSDDASLRSLSDDASLRSLADMWQHYITRLSGNETYGIPSRLSSLTDLPSAPLLVADRKISGCDLADGISLPNILCGAYADVEEIYDTNVGWDASAAKMNLMVSQFTNLTKLTIKAKRILATAQVNIIYRSTFEKIEAPDLEYFGNDESVWNSYFVCTLLQGTSVTKVTMPKLESIHFAQFNGYSDRSAMFRNCYYLEEIDAPNLTTSLSSNPSVTSCALAAGCTALRVVRTNIEIAGSDTGGYYGGLLVDCPELRVFVVGQIKTQATSVNILKDANGDSNMPNLIHFEIGAGTEVSLNFSRWNPTMALRTDTTASDYVDLQEDTTTYQNNQEQFLANFRAYILDKLKPYVGETGKPTLTLSQPVYDLVSAQDWYTQEKARINWEITA